MLTEYEVRRQVADIQTSPDTTWRKVRKLMRLGRSLKTQVKSLSRTRETVANAEDRSASAGLTRMTDTSQALREDVRDAALKVLRLDRWSSISKN